MVDLEGIEPSLHPFTTQILEPKDRIELSFLRYQLSVITKYTTWAWSPRPEFNQHKLD